MGNKTDYKVTNTTRWAGVKKGKHRNGFIIALFGRNLHVGRHMFVDKISEGIEALQERKFVKVEAVEDRNVSIKKKVEDIENQNEKERLAANAKIKKDLQAKENKVKKDAKEELAEINAQTEASRPASSLDKQAMKDAVKGDMPVNTAKVPNDGQSEDPLKDIEDAVDENPNFVVQAGKKKNNRSRSNKKN